MEKNRLKRAEYAKCFQDFFRKLCKVLERNFGHFSQMFIFTAVQTARDIDFFPLMYYYSQQSNTSVEDEIVSFILTRGNRQAAADSGGPAILASR